MSNTGLSQHVFSKRKKVGVWFLFFLPPPPFFLLFSGWGRQVGWGITEKNLISSGNRVKALAKCWDSRNLVLWSYGGFVDTPPLPCERGFVPGAANFSRVQSAKIGRGKSERGWKKI